MCSPSPLRRQMRQYACSEDRDQATLVSSTEQWTHSCDRLVDSISDSSQRSSAVRCFFARDSTSTLAMLPSTVKHSVEVSLNWTVTGSSHLTATYLHRLQSSDLAKLRVTEHRMPQASSLKVSGIASGSADAVWISLS